MFDKKYAPPPELNKEITVRQLFLRFLRDLWINRLLIICRGVETILKVEGPDLMGSARSGINSEFCLSVLAKASFCKAFGTRTNGKGGE